MLLFSTSSPRFAHFLTVSLPLKLGLKHISQSSSARLQDTSGALGSWGQEKGREDLSSITGNVSSKILLQARSPWQTTKQADEEV